MGDHVNQEWLKQLGNKKFNPELIPPLEEKYEYHVLIAYTETEEDIDFARSISNTLKDLGFEVYFAQDDGILGGDRLAEQSEALEKSLKVLALITPSAVGNEGSGKSTHHEFKFMIGAACCQMIMEGKVLTIPILKNTTERDIPLTAKFGNYIDCVRYPKTWFKELVDLLIVEGTFLGEVCPITNIGEGAAWSYINGYLKVILPKIEDTIRILCQKTSPEKPPMSMNQTSLKLHVVIPETGRIPSSFCEVDEYIQDVESVEVCKIVERPYTTTVREVKDSDGKTFYFLGESASSVKTMYETMKSTLTTLNSSNFKEQVIKFKKTLELLSYYRQTKPLADRLEITYYRDQGENEEKLSELLVQKIKEEIEGRSEEESMAE